MVGASLSDAAVAVATMLVLSVISGFLAAAVTGDRTLAMTTMDTVFSLIAAERLLRVWLFSPKPVSSINRTCDQQGAYAG
jgi:hypothetical protein